MFETYNTFRQFPVHFHHHVHSLKPTENHRCFLSHVFCCIHLVKLPLLDHPNELHKKIELILSLSELITMLKLTSKATSIAHRQPLSV